VERIREGSAGAPSGFAAKTPEADIRFPGIAAPPMVLVLMG